ncbi:putative ribonuclease H-like domain-containing protein [Tanacetum coccineum]
MVNHQNFPKKTHTCAKKNLVPRAVLMKSGLVSINTARQVNAAHSKTTVNATRPMLYLSKIAHSTVKRPIHKNTTFKNSNINQRVNTVRGKKINTARPKAVVNAVKGNNYNAGNPQMDLQDQGVIDSGCSRHMTGNMSNLIDYEEIDGGYVAFGGNPKGGKITGKGKFDGKADKGFFVGYSLNSKAFRVFNSRTRIVEENLHIRFSESTPNIVGTQSNSFAGTKASDNAGQARKETEPSSHDDGSKPSSDDGKKVDEDPRKDSECKDQEKEDNVNSTNTVNAAGINKVNAVGGKTSIELPFDPNMHALEDYSIFDFSRDDEDDGAVADMNNLDTTIQVSPNPTTRIHKDHPLDQEEPKKVIHALKDPSWIEAMQEELLQFKLQEVWTLVDLPNGKRAIGSKWVFRNKKDERGIVIRNKARLMSSMRELTFFLGLQVKQNKDGIFISQDKYVDEILKKFGFIKVKTASISMETQKPLLKDEVVWACARYQVNLKVSHLHFVKRIFRYLKGQPKLGLWYPKDSLFDLVAYTDMQETRGSGCNLNKEAEFVVAFKLLWTSTLDSESTT